jgi:RNA polymerase sigma factor for flagellar operon FliA
LPDASPDDRDGAVDGAPEVEQDAGQRAAQAGRDQLILGHLWLVRHVIGRLFPFFPPGLDVENLESAGTLGLVQATRKYDPRRGVKFKTYAYIRIRGAILDELRRNCPLPQHIMEQVAQVRRAYEQLPPRATVEELAAATGLSTDTVLDCLSALRLTRMLSWEDAAAAGDLGARDRHHQADLLMEQAEQKQLLAQAIAALPQRERLVVTLYYMEELRLKEIGVVLHLSESRVSRVLSAALFQLGEYLRARGA